MKKKITTVLFDLDGTLLPMDLNAFIKEYFTLLGETLKPHGYAPETLAFAMWNGIRAMIGNDGTRTNEEAFWTTMKETYGEDVMKDLPLFDSFYRNGFQKARIRCGFQPLAAEVVHKLKSAGFRIVLATSPVYPLVGTQERIRWAGLEPEDFELITTYENSSHTKPNPAYYADIARVLGEDPSACLMIGNDAEEDMVASQTGMQVYLVTDHLINAKNKDITVYPRGTFADLADALDGLIATGAIS